MAFVCLLSVWRRKEARSMVVVACFPDDDDLIDGDVTALPIVIAQVQHARFDFQDFTTQARRAAAVNVDLLPDKPCQKVFHFVPTSSCDP